MTFRIAHIAWALFGITVSVAIWAVGHGVLWDGRRLAIRGRASVEDGGASASGWPARIRGFLSGGRK